MSLSMDIDYQVGSPTAVKYNGLSKRPTSFDVGVELELQLLYFTDVCIGHTGHRHFVIGHLLHRCTGLNRYTALTIKETALETKFVSNKGHNCSVQKDNENGDNDIHDNVQNRLSQPYVCRNDNIGRQMTLITCHW